MQRRFSKLAIVSAAFVVVVGLAIVIRGDEALRQRTGFPRDWSHSHVIFSNPGSFAQAVRNGSVAHWYKIMNDPRYQMQQLRRNAPAMQRNVARLKPTPPKPAPPKAVPVAKDWNFSLQTTGAFVGVAYGRYPAKYSFNETGASCANDFIIYGLNVAGTSAQANLVGVNNIYVGASGGGGCGSITNTGGAGTAPTPEVMWAFNVGSGSILSNVVLSLDGTKVAYVVNVSPHPVLQVLTLPTTQSGKITTPTNPSTTCGAAAPSICTVTLSSSSVDSNSSPYVDYGDDVGYVGDNTGHLYRISGLFKGTPAIDSTWTTNPVSAGSSELVAPVYDGVTQTVFVASYDGYLYGFNSSGSQISGSPLQLAVSGVSSNSDGILAVPIVDSTNHVLYTFYGDNAIATLAGCPAGDCPEVAQVVFTSSPKFASTTTSALTTAGTNLAQIVTTNPNQDYITEGAFDENYFSSFPSGSSFLYTCGSHSGSDPVGVTLQQFSFNGSGILQNSAVTVDTISTSVIQSQITAVGGQICSPQTEFYNTNGTAIDYLFLSVPALGEVLSFKLPSGGGTTGSMSPANTTTGVVGGTSGIIVDGADPTSIASSLYFTSQSGTGAACTDSSDASPANNGIGSAAAAICAYKLTQNGLQ
jgi:hypothetical protein